ncbi:MAG TPA: 5-formyltetrahydrofolate cyclo-ligase [Burkholderiaceae bacterium]|nr:5-formyltetrahydrofolate cyclo-ligase [Burkholderiaceae bacterium]
MQHTDTDDERAALRRKLIAAREALGGRIDLIAALQDVLRVWLVGRHETSIGAYWPIKGEFDPLPALYRWTEGGPDGVARRIGLPRVDRASGSLRWHIWFPGCPMEPDAYDIPKPKGTDELAPELLVVPCLGYGPGGVRLGYGGGFFERTMRTVRPRPTAVGVSFAQGFLPLLRPGPLDFELDAVLTEDGVMWQRG